MAFRMKGANDMKLYNVFVYNYVESFADIYMVKADDPVDARGRGSSAVD